MAAAPALELRAVPSADEDRRGALAALVESRGPLRAALVALAMRFVALRGWERLGLARLADWARERVGLSTREVQDLAHVAGVLGRVRPLERALVTGELGWTKVRLIARVADGGSAAAWIGLARRRTVRELERDVRAVDRGALEAGGARASWLDKDERETLRIRCTPEVHAKWWALQGLVRRVAGQNLPAWECAEAAAAKVIAVIGLETDAHGDPELPADASALTAARTAGDAANACASHGRESLGTRGGAAPADTCAAQGCGNAGTEGESEPEPPPEPALPSDAALAEARALVSGLDAADTLELDRRLREAVRREQQVDARVGALLFALGGGRFRGAARAALADRARDALGMSPRRARALVRLERAARRWPALGAAYRSGRLSWQQAHALAPLAFLPDATERRNGWLDHASHVTVRRLLEDVDAALVMADTDPNAFAATAGLSGDAVAGDAGRQTRARTTGATETSLVAIHAPLTAARLVSATIWSVRRALERATGRPATAGAAFEAILDHALATWTHLDPSQRPPEHRRIFERDGWRCAVPGCTSYRNPHAHHLKLRSAGGGDEAENLVTLCAWHHLRALHAGILRALGRAPNRLRFELPVGVYASGDRRLTLRTPAASRTPRRTCRRRSR
jgi:hypothetical protein